MPSLFSVVVMTVLLLTLHACDDRPAYPEQQSNWRSLNMLEGSTADFSLKVKVKKAYVLGEEIKLAITSPKKGKLWVIYVDPDDQLSLLFPNHLATDNNIQANQLISIPADRTWTMRAIEPAGQSMLAFIVTTNEKPLFKLTVDDPPTMNKAVSKLTTLSSGWSISRHVIDVSSTAP